MKYLTTLAVARELSVSKQTLLNWLYDGKVPEPPRNRRGYRLWSPARVRLVRKLIGDGRLKRRTVLHQDGSADLLADYAREVRQFLKESKIDALSFMKELGRLDPEFRRVIRKKNR